MVIRLSVKPSQKRKNVKKNVKKLKSVSVNLINVNAKKRQISLHSQIKLNNI